VLCFQTGILLEMRIFESGSVVGLLNSFISQISALGQKGQSGQKCQMTVAALFARI
jgi:hypothetical protein